MSREGVIKFNLQYQPTPAVSLPGWQAISAWRQLLVRLQLIGQDPRRYQGLGFGNLSWRLPPSEDAPRLRPFAISGTQTGGVPQLLPEHYAQVLECDPARNFVRAQGPVQPSSEALTHASLYALDEQVRVVIHVHSPELWQQGAALVLPVTDPAVDYGTPQLAAEVARLLADQQNRQLGLIIMGGHQDGVVAFGASAEAVGTTLVRALARALTLPREISPQAP
jgi:Class II Aldolase and Adducin N-terminal domain